MANFTIMRIGSVGESLTRHFMRDQSGNRTACGRVARHMEDCTKSRGIHAVQCGTCWRIKHATLPKV